QDPVVWDLAGCRWHYLRSGDVYGLYIQDLVVRFVKADRLIKMRKRPWFWMFFFCCNILKIS
ncbi:hypothetical protein M8C21_025555, partial [Ambrosia artemisiifolia]